MSRYSFDEVKEKINKMIAYDSSLELNLSEHVGESMISGIELSLFMYGKEYMIIVFKEKCSFQRCSSGAAGAYDGSEEFYYNTLDELYTSITVDDILLKRDWDNITDFQCSDYGWDYE